MTFLSFTSGALSTLALLMVAASRPRTRDLLLRFPPFAAAIDRRERDARAAGVTLGVELQKADQRRAVVASLNEAAGQLAQINEFAAACSAPGLAGVALLRRGEERRA